MSWASSRQAFILAIIGVVVLTLVALVAIATFYDAPSCTDGKQNQDEIGIDCGGSCQRLCRETVLSPVVSFARAITVSDRRTDVIAYIENPNPAAISYNAPYFIEIYDAERNMLGTYEGALDLPPASLIPLYIPNAVAVSGGNAQAFLSFDTSVMEWFPFNATAPSVIVRNVVTSAVDAPRVTATVENVTANRIPRVMLVATVFDGAGNAIAASQTVATDLAAFGSASVIFTWNTPFTAVPARIDVRPLFQRPGL